MSATLYLEEPVSGDEYQIECEAVQILGEVVWATPTDGTQETVVPIANVTGVKGDSVEQEIEEIESLGGRFTELVTKLS